MRIFLNYLTLILLLGTTGVVVSCDKEDDIASITLKKVGNLKVNVQNSGKALSDVQVRISNADTGSELKVMKTDGQGVIDLQDLIEGTYVVTVELEEPKYLVASQQFQVISGESKEVTMEAADHTGSLRVFLLDNTTYPYISIKEDLKIGMAIVPNSIAYKKALSNKEKIALATDIQYFGNKGEVSFENIPSGDYIVFRVAADTIYSSWTSYGIRRADERTEDYSVNYLREVISLKSSFSVSSFSATEYYYAETVTESPFSSFRFYQTNGESRVTITMENGVVFNTSYYIDNSGSYSIYSTYSEDGNYYLRSMGGYSGDKITYKDGQMELRAYNIEVIDYSGANEDFDYYNAVFKLN